MADALKKRQLMVPVGCPEDVELHEGAAEEGSVMQYLLDVLSGERRRDGGG